MALQNQLDSFEQRLAQLLTIMDAMAAENARLQERQQELVGECTRLQEKNEAASLQIETIIARLKQQPTSTETTE